jgi:hypothetical protein
MRQFSFKRWDEWWCGQVPPHALAIVRIGFGLFLFIEAMTYVPGIDVLLSSHGLIFSLWADRIPASVRFLLEPPEPIVANAIACVYVLACLLLAAGCAMRTALAILILLFLYYWQLSFHLFPSSYHRMFFFILVVLSFSGADRTLSFRMWRRAGSCFSWEPISILPQRLIAAQITATYIGVSWQKIWLPDWQNGNILFFSFMGKWGTPPAYFLARILPQWSFDALNWIVKLFEFFLPFCLWMRDWRLFAIIAGTIFHVSVALLLGIWWFLILPPAYVIFFDPYDVHRWLHTRFPGYIRL